MNTHDVVRKLGAKPASAKPLGFQTTLSIIGTCLPDEWDLALLSSRLLLTSLQLYLYRAVLDFLYSQVHLNLSSFKL